MAKIRVCANGCLCLRCALAVIFIFDFTLNSFGILQIIMKWGRFLGSPTLLSALALALAVLPLISAQSFSYYNLVSAGGFDFVQAPNGFLYFTSKSAASIARLNVTTGVLDLYSLLPHNASSPTAITIGPDLHLYFGCTNQFDIYTFGRMSFDGLISIYSATIGGPLKSIATGPDAALWFVPSFPLSSGLQQIDRLTISDTLTLYDIPTTVCAGPLPYAIARGPGGMWFSSTNSVGGYCIGIVNATGSITSNSASIGVFHLWCVAVYAGAGGLALVRGPVDGNMWLASGNHIQRITASINITNFGQFASSTDSAAGITAAANGDLFITAVSGSAIWRMTTSGIITQFDLPANLPYPVTAGPITSGADGGVYFLFGSYVGRLCATSVSCAQPCLAGSFSTSANYPRCNICPPGVFTSRTNAATSCNSCRAGSYSMSQATSCSICGITTFSRSRNSSNCLPCGTGESFVVALFCSHAVVFAVLLGHYCNATGMSSATACPIGRYSTRVAAMIVHQLPMHRALARLCAPFVLPVRLAAVLDFVYVQSITARPLA